MTMEMNSIDQINFKHKKNGFKNLQRKHCHSFSFPFWNARKTRNKWKEIKIRNNHVNLKQTIIQQSF